jgi:hypothetical protein
MRGLSTSFGALSTTHYAGNPSPPEKIFSSAKFFLTKECLSN